MHFVFCQTIWNKYPDGHNQGETSVPAFCFYLMCMASCFVLLLASNYWENKYIRMNTILKLTIYNHNTCFFMTVSKWNGRTLYVASTFEYNFICVPEVLLPLTKVELWEHTDLPGHTAGSHLSQYENPGPHSWPVRFLNYSSRSYLRSFEKIIRMLKMFSKI